MKQGELLIPVSEIQVPAHDIFDGRDEWKPGFRTKGPEQVKFSWFQPEFKENYLGIKENREGGKLVNEPLDSHVVERDIPEKTIVVYKLVQEARDPEIIKALIDLGGGYVIAFAHLFDVVARQPNGEYLGPNKGLRINHFDNIAYCMNRHGVDRSISFDYFNPGWSMKTDEIEEPVSDEAHEIEIHGSWRVGDYILAYKA